MTQFSPNLPRFTESWNAASTRFTSLSNRLMGNRSIKPAMPSLILNGIWSASGTVKSIPIAKDTISRPIQEDSKVEITANAFVQDPNKKPLADFNATRERFGQYSIYPPFPTKPAPLNIQQAKLLSDNAFINTIDLDSKLQEKGRSELLSREAHKTAYIDLSPEARKVYNAVNLALVQEHLQDISKLANAAASLDLSPLGVDYFEVEIYDTLARGLAYIDKDLLKDLRLEVPVRQADGQFKLEEYSVDRFNLSGAEKNPTGEIDHNQGHPLFILKPVDKKKQIPPLVIARGTLLADDGHDGAVASVQADGRKDLSMKWIMGNGELKEKLDAVYKDHGPIRVAGHSLGGNIALGLAIAYSGHIDSALTFSTPQLSKEVYQAWKKIPLEERPKIDNIFVEGDLVPSGGRKIPGNVISAQAKDSHGNPDPCRNATERHLLPFNNSRVTYAAVDKDQEIHKLSRRLAAIGVVVAGRGVQDFSVKAGRLAAKILTDYPDSNAPPPDPSRMPTSSSDDPDRKTALARLNNRESRMPEDAQWKKYPSWNSLEGGHGWGRLERMPSKQINERYADHKDDLLKEFKGRLDNNLASPALMQKMYAIMSKNQKAEMMKNTKFAAFVKFYEQQLDPQVLDSSL